MNIKQIRELADILEEKKLTAMEVCEGDFSIRLEKSCDTVYTSAPAAAAAISAQQPAEQTAAIAETPVNFNNIKEVKSPMVGIFYAAPAPDAPPFVTVGSKVKKGDVLCIIEAMKIMNEITSDADGEIVDICAGNGQVVEFSQILFKIF